MIQHCIKCGEEFHASPSDKRTYCSRDCYWESHAPKKGKLTNINIQDIVNMYCSERKTLRQIADIFNVTPCAIKYNLEKHHIPRRKGQYIVGHLTSNEVRCKISQSSKGIHKNNGHLGMKHSEETKVKMSLTHKGVPKSATMKLRLSETQQLKGGNMRGKHLSSESKTKISDTLKAIGHFPPWWLAKPSPHSEEDKIKMREVWNQRKLDSEKMSAWVKAVHLLPNKAEIKLDEMLQVNFPHTWKYTGDGTDGTQIGGKIPDWINVNGEKAVIELFGEYWHHKPNNTKEYTLSHYVKYGIDCLIIDYRELRKMDQVIRKVKEFVS